jgi:transcriptional regulator with XRE-family HTH domain
MQTEQLTTLRDLVLHHGVRRGWRTQRHIAVACGLDETALSRFLNGDQDLGARRTHALFRAVGIPVDQYDLAYALLGRAQDAARAARVDRQAHERAAPSPAPLMVEYAATMARIEPAPVRLLTSGRSRRDEPRRVVPLPEREDMPAAAAAAIFSRRRYTGADIAAFLGG